MEPKSKGTPTRIPPRSSSNNNNPEIITSSKGLRRLFKGKNSTLGGAAMMTQQAQQQQQAHQHHHHHHQQQQVADIEHQPALLQKKKRFQAAGVYRPTGGGNAAAVAPKGAPQLYHDFQQPAPPVTTSGGGAPDDRVASMLYLKESPDEVSAITLNTFASLQSADKTAAQPSSFQDDEQEEEAQKREQQRLLNQGPSETAPLPRPFTDQRGRHVVTVEKKQVPTSFLNVREPDEAAKPTNTPPPRPNRTWKHQVFRPGAVGRGPAGGGGGGVKVEERPGIKMEERPPPTNTKEKQVFLVSGEAQDGHEFYPQGGNVNVSQEPPPTEPGIDFQPPGAKPAGRVVVPVDEPKALKLKASILPIKEPSLEDKQQHASPRRRSNAQEFVITEPASAVTNLKTKTARVQEPIPRTQQPQPDIDAQPPATTQRRHSSDSSNNARNVVIADVKPLKMKASLVPVKEPEPEMHARSNSGTYVTNMAAMALDATRQLRSHHETSHDDDDDDDDSMDLTDMQPPDAGAPSNGQFGDYSASAAQVALGDTVQNYFQAAFETRLAKSEPSFCEKDLPTGVRQGQEKRLAASSPCRTDPPLRRPSGPDEDEDHFQQVPFSWRARRVSVGERKPSASARRVDKGMSHGRHVNAAAPIPPIRETSATKSAMEQPHNENDDKVKSANKGAFTLDAPFQPRRDSNTYQKVSRPIDNVSIPPVTEPTESHTQNAKYTVDMLENERGGRRGRLVSSRSSSTSVLLASLPSDQVPGTEDARLQSDPCLAYTHDSSGDPSIEVFHASGPGSRPRPISQRGVSDPGSQTSSITASEDPNDHLKSVALSQSPQTRFVRPPKETREWKSQTRHSLRRHHFVGGTKTDKSLISEEEEEEEESKERSKTQPGGNRQEGGAAPIENEPRLLRDAPQRFNSQSTGSSISYLTDGSGESIRIVPFDSSASHAGSQRSLQRQSVGGMRESIVSSIVRMDHCMDQDGGSEDSQDQDDNAKCREWACGDCSYVNRQCDDSCAVCGSKNVAEVFTTNARPGLGQAESSRSALRSSLVLSPTLNPNGAWMCLTCTYMNENSLHLSCDVCGEPRSKSNVDAMKLMEEGEPEQGPSGDEIMDEFKEKVSGKERILALLGEQGEILNELQGMKAFRESSDPEALAQFQKAVQEKGQKLDEIRQELERSLEEEHKEQEMVEQMQERRRSQMLEATGASSLDELVGGTNEQTGGTAPSSADALEWMAQQRMLDDWRSQVEARALQLEEMRLQQEEVLREYGGRDER